MNLLVAMPVLVPLATAAAGMAAWRSTAAQRLIGLAGSVALLVVAALLARRVAESGTLALQMGAWPAPMGISFVADMLSCVMVLMAAVVGVGISAFSLGGAAEKTEASGHHSLVHVLLAGCCGAFLTGDIFNLYVWFEVLLIASFVLLSLGGTRAQLEGTLKSLVLNLLSSGFFLAGVGLLYGVAGTLNFADLAGRLATPAALERSRELTAIGVLFLLGFGIKAAVFPLHFWLPASYNAPAPVVGALFAGLLSKVGVYAIARTGTLVFTQEQEIVAEALLGVGGVTMLAGVFGAATASEMRRILAFHSVSQIGYMVAGLGLCLLGRARGDEPLAQAALAATVAFMLHHALVKGGLFLVAGAVLRRRGTTRLAELGGLHGSQPLLAALFLIPALSLAGIPPLSGFWAKLAIVRAGVDGAAWGMVGVAVFTGLLTLYSMTKIWGEAFWKPAPDAPANNHAEPGAPAAPAAPDVATTRGLRWMTPVLGAVAALTVAMGVGFGPVWSVAKAAARDALDVDRYRQAVLPPAPAATPEGTQP